MGNVALAPGDNKPGSPVASLGSLYGPSPVQGLDYTLNDYLVVSFSRDSYSVIG